MVAYSFQERFCLPILAGTKRQTIRKERTGRTRHARPGEQVQLYTAMRTKHCDLICKPVCKLVEPIRMRVKATARERCSVETPSMSEFYAAASLDEFARQDGFEDWSDLVAFWMEKHPAVDVFNGVRIVWAPS